MTDLRMLRVKVLAPCRTEKTFWMSDGKLVGSIYQLVNVVNSQTEEVFKYHVNSYHHKNDFSKWVREVLEDEELADKLEKVMDKDEFVRVLRARIKELEEY